MRLPANSCIIFNKQISNRKTVHFPLSNNKYRKSGKSRENHTIIYIGEITNRGKRSKITSN